MAATWITPIEVTPGTAVTWIDVDVSASVPAGATGVILHVANTYTSARAFGARKNGSTDARTQIHLQDHFWAVIGVDANRIFECYVQNTIQQDVYLVGYFTDDSVFFDNAIDKSLNATTTWTDIDISADTGGATAIAAYFEVIKTDANRVAFGLRKNGSTDARIGALRINNSHRWAVIGVDGSEICEGYIETTVIDFFLVGYCMTLATLNTNAVDLSLGGIDAWTDLSALTIGATGGIIEAQNASDDSFYYGLRKNGSAEDIYMLVSEHAWGLVECDINRIIEGKISNTGVDFFEIGVFLAAAAGGLSWSGAGTLTQSGAINRHFNITRGQSGAI